MLRSCEGGARLRSVPRHQIPNTPTCVCACDCTLSRAHHATQGYEEIARPLEPFVFVFVLFGIPACVMASEWCVHESSANSANTASASIGYQSESYGTCDVWCELVLAFRSLGTAAVFFSQPRNRQELLQFRTLCRRLWARLRFSRGAPTVRFREEGLEEILMIPGGLLLAAVSACSTVDPALSTLLRVLTPSHVP